LPQACAEPVAIDLDTCSVDEWLAHRPGYINEIANTMAHFEREGIEFERPRMWQTDVHMGGISWRPGVMMLYGFNGPEPSPPERDGILQATEEAGFEILATGWSDDRRAWTIFCRAEAGELSEALGVNLRNELSFRASPGLRLLGARVRD
jgi:hypothetical protein